MVIGLAEDVAAIWRRLGDEEAAQRAERTAIALRNLADVPRDDAD